LHRIIAITDKVNPSSVQVLYAFTLTQCSSAGKVKYIIGSIKDNYTTKLQLELFRVLFPLFPTNGPFA
jgi:hypothetical protein